MAEVTICMPFTGTDALKAVICDGCGTVVRMTWCPMVGLDSPPAPGLLCSSCRQVEDRATGSVGP